MSWTTSISTTNFFTLKQDSCRASQLCWFSMTYEDHSPVNSSVNLIPYFLCLSELLHPVFVERLLICFAIKRDKWNYFSRNPETFDRAEMACQIKTDEITCVWLLSFSRRIITTWELYAILQQLNNLSHLFLFHLWKKLPWQKIQKQCIF